MSELTVYLMAPFANLMAAPKLVLFGIVWSMMWTGFGTWRAARLGEKKWFIAMLVLNAVGILPMLYLWFKRKRKVVSYNPQEVEDWREYSRHA